MSLALESGDTAHLVFNLTGLTRLPLARIIAATFLAPMVIYCILADAFVFSLLVAASSVIMAWEWSRMCHTPHEFTQLIGLVIGLLTANYVATIGHPSVAVFVLAASALMLYASSSRSLWIAAGMLYIGLPCIALIWLRGDLKNGELIVLWLVTLVWASDVGAYAVGRSLGGPKLAPKISPGKTWSGVAGGLACAVIWGVGFLFAINLLSFWPAFLASILVGIAAQFGDLLESWIKRQFEVKDTSRLIPGHGGLLDRVDSLILASMTTALFALIVGEKVAT